MRERGRVCVCERERASESEYESERVSECERERVRVRECVRVRAGAPGYVKIPKRSLGPKKRFSGSKNSCFRPKMAPKCTCRLNFESFGTGQACPALNACVLEA